jgi:hypothetical protein
MSDLADTLANPLGRKSQPLALLARGLWPIGIATTHFCLPCLDF